MAVLATGCVAGTPSLPAGMMAIEAARYRCADGAAFTARFDREGAGATLAFDRDDPDAMPHERGYLVALTTQRPGSGIWYAGGGWSLRGKGADATLTRPDGRSSACRSGGPAPGNAPPI